MNPQCEMRADYYRKLLSGVTANNVGRIGELPDIQKSLYVDTGRSIGTVRSRLGLDLVKGNAIFSPAHSQCGKSGACTLNSIRCDDV